MSLENYVMDVFRGKIQNKKFTANVQLELDKALADLGWHLAFLGPEVSGPYLKNTRVYSIKDGNSTLGLGIYVIEQEHPFFRRRYYSVRMQVAASTEEGVKGIGEQSKRAIDGLMSKLRVENTAYDSVIAPQWADTN